MPLPSDRDILIYRAHTEEGEPLLDIAMRFGLSETRIWGIVNEVCDAYQAMPEGQRPEWFFGHRYRARRKTKLEHLENPKIVDRRFAVAEAYFREKRTVREIAKDFDVSEQIVRGDVKWLLKLYRESVLQNIDEVVVQEIIELNEMERDAVRKFIATGSVQWFESRLKVKAQRAKLLGLDAPQRVAVTGPDGGPIQHEFDFSHLTDEELLDAVLAEVVTETEGAVRGALTSTEAGGD